MKKLIFRFRYWWYQTLPIGIPAVSTDCEDQVVVDENGNEAIYLFTSRRYREVHIRIRQQGTEKYFSYEQGVLCKGLSKLVFISDLKPLKKRLLGLLRFPKLPKEYLVNCMIYSENAHLFYDMWGERAKVTSTITGIWIFNSPNVHDRELGNAGDDAHKNPVAFAKKQIHWHSTEVKKG